MDFIVIQPPGQHEGEPHQVAELVNQDLARLGQAVGEHVAAAYVQHRAAGIGKGSVEEWEETPHGEAAAEVRMRAVALIQSIRRLTAQELPVRR